jgi:hypothetical protein
VRESPPTRTVKATIVRDGARRSVDVRPETGSVTRDGFTRIGRHIEQHLRYLRAKYRAMVG